MADLDRILDELRSHPGVEHILILGRDGLLVRHVGDGAIDADMVSAMVPGISGTGAQLGGAAGYGRFSTAVVELDRGVGVVIALSGDLLALVLLRAGVGFGPLLTRLRRNREELAQAI